MATSEAHDESHAEGEGEGGGLRSKLTPRLMMIIGGGAAAFLLVVGVVLYLFVFSGPSAHEGAPAAEGHAAEGHGGEGHGAAAEEGHKAEASAKEGEAAHGSAEASPIIELDDMVVNLSTMPGKRASYLKLKVAIEIAKPELRPEVEKQKPRIVDTFQVYLRELRTEDIRGSVGIVRLREELLARVTAAVAPVEVRDVLFKEILVQ